MTRKKRKSPSRDYGSRSVFITTRQQYEKASKICAQARDDIRHGLKVTSGSRAHHRHIIRSYMDIIPGRWFGQDMIDKIPLSKPGRKKYQAVIVYVRGYEDVIGYSVFDKLKEIGIELVDPRPKPPRTPEDEMTTVPLTLKTYNHLKKVASILDKKYGPGQWRIRGGGKQRDGVGTRLKVIEALRAELNSPGGPADYWEFSESELEEARNGIRVTVCVRGKADGLEKDLFKATLMA